MGSVNRHLRGKKYTNFPEHGALLIEQHCKQLTHIQETIEHYDEVLQNRALSDNLTVDSGVTTFRDETSQKSPKKLSFSPENDEVIEIKVEKYQPKYYDILPQKCIAHISETPKPQKIQYKEIVYNSTPKNKNGELTKEVLQAANLIRDRHCDPECVLDLSAVDKTFVRSPSCRSMDDKFVVNLFESRQSKRWKRKGVCIPDETIHSLIDTTPQVIQVSEPESHKTVSKYQRSVITF